MRRGTPKGVEGDLSTDAETDACDDKDPGATRCSGCHDLLSSKTQDNQKHQNNQVVGPYGMLFISSGICWKVPDGVLIL